MASVRAEEIEQRIAEACRRSGRRREEVTLVAVTKTLPPEVINEALACGITDIGENRVQEYLGKRGDLAAHRLHLIGHLQRNKVRSIIGACVLIHSVDSVRLADEIQLQAAAGHLTVPVLIEVNTSGEASKDGVPPGDVEALAAHVLGLPNLRLRGLMTVAAFTDDPALVRPSFSLLRTLRDTLDRAHPGAGIRELSMGMSHDFEIAIEEGATIVRIGTALFGARPPAATAAAASAAPATAAPATAASATAASAPASDASAA